MVGMAYEVRVLDGRDPIASPNIVDALRRIDQLALVVPHGTRIELWGRTRGASIEASRRMLTYRVRDGVAYRLDTGRPIAVL